MTNSKYHRLHVERRHLVDANYFTNIQVKNSLKSDP